jgi:hypothetical protein
MLIPHIAYWGSKFSWRGEIKFDTAEEWDRFFTDYETWIVEMARLAEAHGAAVFCVGLEYTHAQKFEQRWRKIIAAVRSVYSGKITYGANWGDYDAVKFWDAVDYLGVLAYFPLTTATNPSAEQIATGWRKRCAELQRFSDSHGGKKFLFVEVGYNENARAAAEPWSFDTGGENASAIQQRCLDAALSLGGKEPFWRDVSVEMVSRVAGRRRGEFPDPDAGDQSAAREALASGVTVAPRPSGRTSSPTPR